MKFFLLNIFFFISYLSVAQIVPHDKLPPKPNPPKLVNDYANLLSKSEADLLENKLVAYDNKTSNQIVIVAVDELKGYSKEDYATEIGHYWKVGGQEKMDNGIVILVSTGKKDGKRQYFIATGYGLEGVLSAILVKRIGEAELVPDLKAGNYYEAFDKVTDALIKAIANEYTAPENYRKSRERKDSPGFGAIIFVIIIIAIIIGAITGGGRGGGGGMVSRRGFGSLAEGMFWGTLLGNLGRGGSGGFGGGSSSGGGFGGFGGGDFGGGGAGGDW